MSAPSPTSQELLETELCRVKSELSIVSKALEIKSESLGLGRPVDARSTLLYELSKHQQDARSLAVRLDSALGTISQLETQLATVQSQLADVTLRSDVAVRKAALMAFEEDQNRRARSAAEEELSRVLRQAGVATQFVREQAEKIAQLESKLQAAEQELSDRQSGEATLKLSARCMEEKAAEAQRKLDTLYQELNQKDGALASVSQQLTAAETKLRTTELTNTSLSQRLEDSDEALRLVTADRDRMSSELAKARDDAGALRSELAACNAELERAKIQLRPQLAAQESTANRLHELASKNIMLTLENRQLQDQVNRLLDEVTEAKEKKAEHQHSFAPKLAQLGTGDDVPMQASGRSQSGPQRSSRAADIAAALVKETLRSSADPGSIIASQRRSTLGTTREAPGYDTPAVKRAPQ